MVKILHILAKSCVNIGVCHENHTPETYLWNRTKDLLCWEQSAYCFMDSTYCYYLDFTCLYWNIMTFLPRHPFVDVDFTFSSWNIITFLPRLTFLCNNISLCVKYATYNVFRLKSKDIICCIFNTHQNFLEKSDVFAKFSFLYLVFGHNTWKYGTSYRFKAIFNLNSFLKSTSVFEFWVKTTFNKVHTYGYLKFSSFFDYCYEFLAKALILERYLVKIWLIYITKS